MVAYVMEKSAIRIKSSYKQVVGNVTLPFTVKTGLIFVIKLRLFQQVIFYTFIIFLKIKIFNFSNVLQTCLQYMQTNYLKMCCLLGAELCDYIRLCLLHSAGIRPDLELLADPAHQAPIITRQAKKIIFSRRAALWKINP